MLLADPRIAGRIALGLGQRLAEVEQRLADTVLKTAPQRVGACCGGSRQCPGARACSGGRDPRE
jgi:hypothetical protein